ncbi:MAG: serine/threonine protein kinase [Gemmataceae bacterium]|nr:serine/threonine protein kinase [Gemmataceae bacterium]
MTRDPKPLVTDDDFADRLAALDDAIADGNSAGNSSDATLPPELQQRLQRGFAALQRLRQARPVSRPSTLHVQDGATMGGVSAGPLPFTLGRFEVLRELGRGGFGIVFLVRDPKLNREVALKVPHASALMNGTLRERFRREAQTAAGLTHPNLVPVYEVDEQGPLVAIVSAYCPGPTLAEWLARQTSPPATREVAELVATLANAIEYAHRRGIVHRDLKPANVILTLPDVDNRHSGSTALGRWQPRITDFGLAQLTEDAGDLTQSGAILGTPAYMAPEQARGKGAAAVGPAADIYSLGAILYESLTGRPPFRGETDLETLQLVAQHEPVPPRRLRPRLPRDLETICLKCLEKNPADRYQTCAGLEEDLRRFLDGRPTIARPVSLPGRVRRWCARKPMVAALTAGLIAAIALGAAGVGREYRRAECQRDAAVASSERSNRLLESARKSIGEMVGLGHTLVHDAATVPQGIEVLETGRRYYQQLLIEQPDDIELRQQAIVICRRLGMLYFEQPQLEKADSAWSEANRMAMVLVNGPDGANHRQEYVDFVINWMENLHFSGQWQRSLEVTAEAATMTADDYASHPTEPSAAWKYYGVRLFRGMAQRKLGQFDEGQKSLTAALEALRANYDAIGSPDVVLAETNCLNHLAGIARERGRLEEALQLALESNAVCQRAREQKPDEIRLIRAQARCEDVLGQVRFSRGEWSAAVDLLRSSNQMLIQHQKELWFTPGVYVEIAANTLLIGDALARLGRPNDDLQDLIDLSRLPPPGNRPGRIEAHPADVLMGLVRLTRRHLDAGRAEDAALAHLDATRRMAKVAVRTPEHDRIDGILKELSGVVIPLP